MILSVIMKWCLKTVGDLLKPNKNRYVAIEVTAAGKMAEDSSLSYKKAREQAQEEFKHLDALHLPDQKAGGFTDLVTSLGD